MRGSGEYAIHTPQGDRPSAAYWQERLRARRGYVCTQCGHRSTTEAAFRQHIADCAEVRRSHAAHPEGEETEDDHDAA